MITPEFIEKVIYRFLKTLFSKRRYDLIICGERKATAMLRVLIQEIKDPKLDLAWQQVLSSSAIDAYDWENFQGKTILIFEEMVHHGNGLRRIFKQLRFNKRVPRDIEILTAGFGVWEHCEYRPDFWYSGFLNDNEYTEFREGIIALLQRYGSLLLDTEHIELIVKLECGLSDFFNALARSADDGSTFSFISGAGKLNLTITNPPLLNEPKMKGILTPGSNTKGVVKKVRTVERSHDRFAIIPIFLPNTRCVLNQEWIEGLPQFVDTNVFENNRVSYREVFYLVGLLASIELLRGIVAALGDLISKNLITLEVAEESFTHLSAMFPYINIQGLRNYVTTVVLESKSCSPLHSIQAVKVRDIPENILNKFTFDFFSSLLQKMYDWDDQEKRKRDPNGLSCMEIREISEVVASEFEINQNGLSVEKAVVAVAPDRTIDAGFLNTNVSKIMSSSNEPWAIRTFSPAAEVVTAKFEQQIGTKGNPYR